ncbi:MAG: Nramp family divalent metal transporter [Ectothiorhodospiraceae bacterium]|nr:Nramp family divalent metal transporter [Ectothiorhodospiraceae bacterium]
MSKITTAIKNNQPSLFAIILPGILIAATGVGAGDLATASFAGSQLGLAILWAVIIGSVFKLVLTEGLARWQLVTGQSLLEGLAQKLGPIFAWLFLPYLLLWSFFVGSALMSACGVTLHALFPLFEDANQAKVVFGIGSSLLGLGLVLLGGFRLFEKLMAFSVAVMFAIVLMTAGLLWPGFDGVIQGLVMPSIPDADGKGIAWTIALIGGVGGTLTILCYGYWIREKNRDSVEHIRICRIDLATGYFLTAVFGLAMVIIGSQLDLSGKGAGLMVILANTLEQSLGETGRWLFLIGAFGAVFSSLFGVWQAVPYLFADIYRLFITRQIDVTTVDTQGWPYRGYLVALAIIPMLGLLMDFKQIQQFYGIIGAAFLPLLAITLLIMNSSQAQLGKYSNSWLSYISLSATIVFFAGMAWMKWSV